jgi:hypothetical protein
MKAPLTTPAKILRSGLPVFVLLLCAVAQPLCRAQQIQTCMVIPTQRAPLKIMRNDEFKSIPLTRPVELPNVPLYSGSSARFLSGAMSPNLKGGPAVTMQFAVNGDSNKIIQWYRTLLSQKDWSLMEGMQGINGFTAINGQNICQVTVVGPSNRGAQCNLLVQYKFSEAKEISYGRSFNTAAKNNAIGIFADTFTAPVESGYGVGHTY